MSEKNFHVKRRRTNLDPRMVVGAGYGEFEYVRYDDTWEMWSFETEKFRWKFIKDYGGDIWTGTPTAQSNPYYGDPGSDCPAPDFAWDRK